MNILIAVPTFENIYPDTFKSIYDLDAAGNDLSFEFVRGYDCATARNAIAQKALDGGYDYVLMVDNDVIVPENALVCLLDGLKPVCLGYYAHRDSDNLYRGRTSVCRVYDEEGKKYFNYPLESEYTGDEMAKFREEKKHKIEIHGGGMGCAFISTDVFRKIRYPWFDWVNYKSRGMLSEDLYFCEQCRKTGYKIYTDSRLNCGHMLRHIQYAD